MLFVSFETVTKVNIIIIKRTFKKSPKLLVKLSNALLSVYLKSAKFELVSSSVGLVIIWGFEVYKAEGWKASFGASDFI